MIHVRSGDGARHDPSGAEHSVAAAVVDGGARGGGWFLVVATARGDRLLVTPCSTEHRGVRPNYQSQRDRECDCFEHVKTRDLSLTGQGRRQRTGRHLVRPTFAVRLTITARGAPACYLHQFIMPSVIIRPPPPKTRTSNRTTMTVPMMMRTVLVLVVLAVFMTQLFERHVQESVEPATSRHESRGSHGSARVHHWSRRDGRAVQYRTVSRNEAAALAEIVPETVGLLALAASTFWAVTR